MKLAIIGYGKMGREIEKAALARGHEVIIKIDKDNRADLSSPIFKQAEAALEFTTPETAEENILACFDAGVPVISGTTGWNNRIESIINICQERNQTLFYASNFSIGVNIMFRLNKWLAVIMNKFGDYEPEISEIHHIHKKDSPSGTAITLAEGIIEGLERKESWINDGINEKMELRIHSERAGEVPGTHVVSYKSPNEILEFTHRALDRSVFASGAVLAAEFTAGKKGVLSMNDLLEIQ